MDQDIVYLAPIIFIGFGMILTPFVSNSWPVWLTNFVVFCAEMSNGIWVAGVMLVILILLSVPVPIAALLALPVMFFAGRSFSRMSERMDERMMDTKRQGWEARRKREEEEQTKASIDPDWQG